MLETGKRQVPSLTFFTNALPTSFMLTESPTKSILGTYFISSLWVPLPTQAIFLLLRWIFCLKKKRTEFLLVKKIQFVIGTFSTWLISKRIKDSASIVYSLGIHFDLKKLFLSRFFETKTLLEISFFLRREQLSQLHRIQSQNWIELFLKSHLLVPK